MGLSSAEKTLRYRQRKQDELRCIESGCWEQSLDAERCQKCAEKHAQKQRLRRAAEDQAEEPESP